MGRPISELSTQYSYLEKTNLSDYITLTENIYASKVTGLTLSEYCKARRFHCINNHKKCSECNSMIHAAIIVLEEGIVTLKHVFTTIFPFVTYNAKHHLLQMPLVAIRLQYAKELYLMEKVDGLDYEKLVKFLNSQMQHTSRGGISREELKKLMLISESERERQCIRYAVFKSSCTTPSEARRKYGFDRMDEKAAQVEACIKQAEEIHREIDELARTQDKAFLESLGIQDDSSSESDGDVEMEVDSTDKRISLPDIATLHNLLSASQHNWFEFVERVECMVDDNLNTAGSLEEFFLQIPSLEIEQAKLKLTVQSHRAFMASSVQVCEQDKIA